VSPNTQLFLAKKPHIEDEIARSFSKAVRIPISPMDGYVKSYLEMRLDGGGTRPNAMDDRLRGDIVRAIPMRISEM